MSARRLSDSVRVVLAPNPGPITLDGTNTYIIGERAPVVLDPGPDEGGHLERVLDEAGSPSLVLLSHRHLDHSEGAERFAHMARAPLAAYPTVADGARIDVDGASLVALFTPGHSSDHLSFLLESERALFTGDHVLGRGTTVIAYPDGDLSQYMASLEKARAAGAARLYPGHGDVVEDPDAVLEYYASHRRERERQVLDAIDHGDEEVGVMVARIYADVDATLHPAAALSVHAHLEKLRREGVLTEKDGRWRRR